MGLNLGFNWFTLKIQQILEIYLSVKSEIFEKSVIFQKLSNFWKNKVWKKWKKRGKCLKFGKNFKKWKTWCFAFFWKATWKSRENGIIFWKKVNILDLPVESTKPVLRASTGTTCQPCRHLHSQKRGHNVQIITLIFLGRLREWFLIMDPNTESLFRIRLSLARAPNRKYRKRVPSRPRQTLGCEVLTYHFTTGTRLHWYFRTYMYFPFIFDFLQP